MWQGWHLRVDSARFLDPTYLTRPQSIHTVRYVFRGFVMVVVLLKAKTPHKEAFFFDWLADYPTGLVQL